jgi:hypothetical protein
MVWVVKRDGRKEPFDRKKIIRTCIRSGASRELAEKISREVEKRIYDGITTEEILKIVLELLEKALPGTAARYDLKMALLRLGPAGYEFEHFVARLLQEYGFKTKVHVFVKGLCVTHEVDVIAEKDGKTYMIECKFHNTPGIYTGLKEVMYTYARFLDLKEGYENGKNSIKFDFPWLITNTKFSEDAKRYGRCRNILLTGWRYPANNSIEKMLETKNLYPITILRSLDKRTEEALIMSDYAFCRDILKKPPEEISKFTGIKLKVLKRLIEEAKSILRC